VRSRVSDGKVEVADPFQLPKRWKETSIGEVGGSGQYGLNAAAMTEGTGVRFIRITDIDDRGQLGRCPPAFVPASTPDLKQYELSEGDILIARSGATAGKSYLHRTNGEDGVFAGYLIRFKIDQKKALPAFIFRFLQTKDYWRQLGSHKRAVAQPNVNAKQLASIRFPLPPIPEQERIVAILEAAEELRRSREQADRRTGDLIPALFHEMFGDPAKNPKGWDTLMFEEVCESRLGKMLDAKRQTHDNQRPYLRNVNVKWDRLDLSDLQEMDFNEADREVFRLRRGDILVCEGGEVGRSAIWNDEMQECYFQKALHRVRPIEGLAVPEYILHLMWSLSLGGGFRESVSSATIAHLPGIKLKKIRIPIPPLFLQRDFASRVVGIRTMEANQYASRRRLDDLFQSLLYRAFRGDL
jgi:type I restriction enzyme S subunit